MTRTMDIVIAFILQMIWLPNELVTWTSIVGAALIVTSVVASALRRWLSDKPGKLETVWRIINFGFPPERHEMIETVEDGQSKS